MTEQEAIELLDSFYEMDEMHDAAQIAINALEEIQRYSVLESRLSDMFSGELTLSKCVDELELVLKEPDKPHPINAKILTYEDADKWESYKSIGTPEQCRVAVKFKEYFDELYGNGLEVVNWHQNGDTEPFDNFYESAVDRGDEK